MIDSDIKKLVVMRRVFETVKKRQKVNISKIPDLQNRLKRLRATREKCVGNLDILGKAVENLEDNGFRVKFAEDGSECIKLVLREIGDEKNVVKSKSNVTKEVKLTEELERRNINVVETDIGDRLIQILNEDPSHPTGPASHLSLDSILESLKERFNVKIEKDPHAVIEYLVNDIREHIGLSKVGITGANAITAEGTVLILHNEGNVFEVMNRPKKWVILSGIDKFYPSIDEAVNAAKIQTFFATGTVAPSFIEIVGVNIEKILHEDFRTPKKIVLILLDNNRSSLMNNGFRELFYCISCGNCVINCPSYRVFGSNFKGGRFALYSALYGGKSNLKLCLSCGRCKKNCPLELDIPKMISRVREGNEFYNFLVSHAKWLTRAVYLEALSVYWTLKGEL
jgi:L-lactate dehydrogenase complex protein LldG